VATPTKGTVVLFLAADRERARDREYLRSNTVGGFGRWFVPPVLLTSGAPPDESSVDPARGFPADQLACAQQLLDEAKRSRTTVRIVDVNFPLDEDRALVERFVGPSDILPLLVREDGSRLEGSEAFAPRTIRTFLQGA
jgi:hypothetical protein